MRSSVRKIGNSAGMLLPKPVLEGLGARLGDRLDITLDGDMAMVKVDRRKIREGWEEDSKRIAALGLTDEEKEWLEAPLSDDSDWEW